MFGSLSKNFKGSSWNDEQTAVNYRLCSQRYLCYAGSKKHRRAKPFAAVAALAGGEERPLRQRGLSVGSARFRVQVPALASGPYLMQFGSMAVSKTAHRGSSPLARATMPR